MEDILVLENNSIEETVIDETEFKDDQLSDSDFGSDKSLDEVVLKGEESIDEFKQVDKSDSIILGSNDINNLRSAKNVSINYDIDNFEKEEIWINNNPSNSFITQYINFNNDINDYDLIGFVYNRSINDNTPFILLVPVNDFKSKTPINGNNSWNYLGCGYYDSYYFTRLITYNDDNSVLFHSTIMWPSNSVNDNYCIPVKIIGYRSETLSNNEIPVVSGNNITNNYYIYCDGVSENAVSWNLINKPINEYNVQESFMLLSFTFALCISLYLLIRKAVFKWR